MLEQKQAAEHLARVERRQRQHQKRKTTTHKTPNTHVGNVAPRQRHRQKASVVAIRTFQFHWEPVQLCGTIHGCKHGTKKFGCGMIGVKLSAPAERVERVGRLPEADSEAPDRNTQDAQHTQHA